MSKVVSACEQESPGKPPSITAADAPRVLNLHTQPGKVVPYGAVYIGRGNQRLGLLTSKWANPFRIGRDGHTRDAVIRRHCEWLPRQPQLMAALPELRGRNLACWCAPAVCHGDLLLRLANG